MSEQMEKTKTIDIDLTEDTSAEEHSAAPVRSESGRRGKYALAAPIGFLVSILSIVGVIALVMSLVGFIRVKNDDTALREELYYYLEPLLIYSPTPFENAAKEEQDAFLNAAAYRVMLAENIRMLQEGAEYPKYPVDENYRIAVPKDEITDSYAVLFGKKAKLKHRSIEASGVEYSEGDDCYYIPFVQASFGYEIVIDRVSRHRDRYEVKVGFVPVTEIGYDDHGNPIAPTVEQATYFQTYTLTRNKDKGTYYIKACADETKS